MGQDPERIRPQSLQLPKFNNFTMEMIGVLVLLDMPNKSYMHLCTQLRRHPRDCLKCSSTHSATAQSKEQAKVKHLDYGRRRRKP